MKAKRIWCCSARQVLPFPISLFDEGINSVPIWCHDEGTCWRVVKEWKIDTEEININKVFIIRKQKEAGGKKIGQQGCRIGSYGGTRSPSFMPMQSKEYNKFYYIVIESPSARNHPFAASCQFPKLNMSSFSQFSVKSDYFWMHEACGIFDMDFTWCCPSHPQAAIILGELWRKQMRSIFLCALPLYAKVVSHKICK